MIYYIVAPIRMMENVFLYKLWVVQWAGAVVGVVLLEKLGVEGSEQERLEKVVGIETREFLVKMANGGVYRT